MQFDGNLVLNALGEDVLTKEILNTSQVYNYTEQKRDIDKYSLFFISALDRTTLWLLLAHWACQELAISLMLVLVVL